MILGFNSGSCIARYILYHLSHWRWLKVLTSNCDPSGYSHSDWGEIQYWCSFGLHFPDGWGFWAFFQVFIGHLYFFWELSVQVTCLLFDWISFSEFFIYSGYWPPVEWITSNNFLPFYNLYLYSGNCFLCLQKLLKFDVIPFVNSCSYFLSYWNLFRKSLPMSVAWSGSLCFPLAISMLHILH
jgi:hypothetical protein